MKNICVHYVEPDSCGIKDGCQGGKTHDQYGGYKLFMILKRQLWWSPSIQGSLLYNKTVMDVLRYGSS